MDEGDELERDNWTERDKLTTKDSKFKRKLKTTSDHYLLEGAVRCAVRSINIHPNICFIYILNVCDKKK